MDCCHSRRVPSGGRPQGDCATFPVHMLLSLVLLSMGSSCLLVCAGETYTRKCHKVWCRPSSSCNHWTRHICQLAAACTMEDCCHVAWQVSTASWPQAHANSLADNCIHLPPFVPCAVVPGGYSGLLEQNLADPCPGHLQGQRGPVQPCAAAQGAYHGQAHPQRDLQRLERRGATGAGRQGQPGGL